MEKHIQAAIAAGSFREALTLIAGAYSGSLLRFCYGLVGSESEAEELLQDTLTQTFQALQRFSEASSVRSWVFGIARNICASHLRRRDRRARIWARFSRGDQVAVLPDPLPHDAAQRNQERRLLMAGLTALKPAHREAVLLRYQAGLEGPEIASALGIRPAAARKRISLGLAHLRRQLTPLLADAALTATPRTTSTGASDDGPNTLRAG